MKYYKNKDWLKYQYQHLKKSPQQIADECNTSHMTIYRYLKQFGLI